MEFFFAIFQFSFEICLLLYKLYGMIFDNLWLVKALISNNLKKNIFCLWVHRFKTALFKCFFNPDHYSLSMAYKALHINL